MKLGMVEKNLKRIISHDWADQSTCIMLVSGPGQSKTSICKHVADTLIYPVDGLPCDKKVMHPVGKDSSYTGGYPGLDKSEQGVWEAFHAIYGDQVALRDATRPLICIIDDFGQVAPSAQSAWQQLIEEREFNGVKVSPFVRFIICTNRKEDRANVQAVLSTIRGRSIIVNVEPDPACTAGWLATNYSDVPELGAFIMKRPGFLLEQSTNDAQKRGAIENSPCPRSMEYVAKIRRWACDKESERELVAGAAGKAFADEFCGFLDFWRSLVPTARIIADPENAPLSTNPSHLYAECGSLAHAATRETLPQIAVYINRMVEEFQMYFYKLIEVQKPHLCETTTYIDFKLRCKY